MPDRPRTKSAPILFRVTPQFKAAVVTLAREDGRPLGLFIEKILRDYMRALGIDPDLKRP